MTSLPEDIADSTLRVTNVFAQQLGAFDSNKVEASLRGKGLSHEGLRAARRSVKQDATRWSNTHFLERFRMLTIEKDKNKQTNRQKVNICTGKAENVNVR